MESIKEITQDGFKVTADYGTQGKSVAVIHIPTGTEEEARKNRRELDRVLHRFGFGLAD